MFWIQILSNFFKILRAGQTPRQIAAGVALGAIVGLSPVFTLQGLAVWLVILLLDVNLSAAIFSFTLFALAAFLVDPLFHQIGYTLLVQADSLRGMWTTLYNAPLAPLTRFYNTLVLGSFLSALVISPFVYVGMKKFVVAYRTHLVAKVERWKIYQIISKNGLVKWYRRIRDWGV